MCIYIGILRAYYPNMKAIDFEFFKVPDVQLVDMVAVETSKPAGDVHATDLFNVGSVASRKVFNVKR